MAIRFIKQWLKTGLRHLSCRLNWLSGVVNRSQSNKNDCQNNVISEHNCMPKDRMRPVSNSPVHSGHSFSSSSAPAPGLNLLKKKVVGVRRSNRIRWKQQTRLRQKRGMAASSLPISLRDQLEELGNMEAINKQFLRSEGLLTFQLLRENQYHCSRQLSRERVEAEMECDCSCSGDSTAAGRCGTGCINRMLMIECGPLCSNGKRCTNKRFQLQQGWPCRVFRTEKKGCGVAAELRIPAGEYIVEYVGEVIDSEEFQRRQHFYARDGQQHYYFMALRGEAIIDATMGANISRFINHSCEPNAETQKWSVNGEVRIGLFSVKCIMPGEEITFNYRYQQYGNIAQRCHCGAANCRGWIGLEPRSDEGKESEKREKELSKIKAKSESEESAALGVAQH
ncbi:probable histone-lysine N-methyltransferase [Drosophila madeirensis]|uniref:Probable histone-lysine N-methyltransferase n=1 Tax=Drosophila madeirensis TaxID=30013 RepID=A0AAU9FFR0_DROMD